MISASVARFDDLVAGVGQRFAPPVEVVTAVALDEVVPALRRIDEQTRAGRWAWGFVSYEAAPAFDRALTVGQPSADLPLLWFGLGDAPETVPPIAAAAGSRNYRVGPWQPDWTAAGHRADVTLIRAAIADGLAYQVNLTGRLTTEVRGDLLQFYRDLAHAQRGAHHAYLDTGRHVIASASPELFFEWSDEQLRTRPMKGTSPRGRTSDEDAEHRRRLAASAKERAENLMITDLLRNDLGRLARTGSVTVGALGRPERYDTVWQLTSEVTATPRPGLSLADVFGALFPCGSVTGAPKAAAMQLISRLEGAPRGVYCGAIGVVAPPTEPVRARFSVAIRTVVVDRTTGRAEYGSGGAVTWPSEPDAEHSELWAKAAILTDRPEPFELLETLLYEPGSGPRNLDGHLARLADSAGYFGFAHDGPAIRARLWAELGGAEPSRVRLLLARDGRVRVEQQAAPTPSGPVGLAIDDTAVDSRQRWLFHKTTRRRVYVEAAARHPDADDVVLVNEHGEVTETTVANLAVRLDGRWWTPPISVGCLPGVERARLLASGGLAERVVTVADLRRSEAIALVSSLRGWRAGYLL